MAHCFSVDDDDDDDCDDDDDNDDDDGDGDDDDARGPLDVCTLCTYPRARASSS